MKCDESRAAISPLWGFASCATVAQADAPVVAWPGQAYLAPLGQNRNGVGAVSLADEVASACLFWRIR